MADTRLSALLDKNIIHAEYYFDPETANTTLSDVTFRLIHSYVTSNKVPQEIILQEFTVPSANLKVSGMALTSQTLEQRATIRILNPKYLDGLYLESHEIRDNAPVITRVPILTDPTAAANELISNPQREPTFSENLPALPPESNVVTQEEPLSPLLYSLAQDGILLIQASARHYLDENNTFRTQAYNTEAPVLYLENAISNLAPNSEFLSVNPVSHTPDGYEVEAPGFIMNSDILVGPISGTKVWRLRASLPSFLSAFNVAAIKLSEKAALPVGLTELTVSAYYHVVSALGETPFKNLVVKVSFFDSLNTLVGTHSKTIPVAAEGLLWNLISATFTGAQIPLSANQYSFTIGTDAVESTDSFDLQFYLPQVEPFGLPTTRTTNNRVQDRYQANRAFEIKPPFYLSIVTTHSNESGLRGLMDSTVAGKGGYQFAASGNRLFLRVVDDMGAQLLSVFSSSIILASGSSVNYGVHADGTQVTFYANNTQVSTQPGTITLVSTNRLLVGSLDAANTAANARIEDFGIYTDKPI